MAASVTEAEASKGQSFDQDSMNAFACAMVNKS
jgi:hypothetical protein